MDRFFVITGGPGSGKTSLIAALDGMHRVPEAGRAIIQEEVARGGSALPWKDPLAFAEKMLARDIAAWEAAQRLEGPVIFDRGIPDVMGYLKWSALPVPSHLAQAAAERRYNRQVFLAPPWPEIFTQDAERKQTLAEAEATCRIMREVYTGLGYELVELPFAPAVERAAFVRTAILAQTG
jgi:predicted ATPase